MGNISIPKGIDDNMARVLRELSQQLEKVQKTTDKISIENDDRGRPRINVDTKYGRASVGATVEHKANENELGRNLDGKKKDIFNIRKIKCDEIEVSNDSVSIGTGRVHFDEDVSYIDTKRGPERISTYGTYWDDLRFPAQAINPTGLVALPAWDSTNLGWSFSGTEDQMLHIIGQLPHSYEEGADLVPHIHWENADTSANNVRWLLEYRWRNNGEVAGAFTSVPIVVSPGTVANMLMITSFGYISKADANISSIIEVKLSRTATDISDTNDSEMILKEFDIHYPINSEGSRKEYVK